MLTSTCCGCERKPKKHHGHEDNESTPLLGENRTPVPAADKEEKKPNTTVKWSEVLTFQSVVILSIYASLGLHSVAFDSVLPVFLNHPRQDLVNDPDVKLPFKFSSGFGIGMSQSLIPYTWYIRFRICIKVLAYGLTNRLVYRFTGYWYSIYA